MESRNRSIRQALAAAVVLGSTMTAPVAWASMSVQATKDNASPAHVTEAQFTIASSQVVHWSATYTGGPTAGHSFYLSTVASNLADIPLTTSGELGNDQLLAAGTYHISIDLALMGPGFYTVEFNRTASMGALQPYSHDFGSGFLTADPPSAPFAFKLHSTGDVPVTLSGATSSDPHFEVSSAPSGAVPPDKTFQVRYNPGATAGTFSGVITATGTSAIATVAPVTFTVSGTTQPRVPNISCSGSPDLGSADYAIGETKNVARAFQNTGTEALALTAINVVNDTAGGVFTANGAPSLVPLAAGGTRNVSVHFAPPNTGEASYTGHLEIHSNDPEVPIKICFFHASGHHPAPRMRLAAATLDYHDVELGFSFTKAIAVFNDGDADLDVTVAPVAGNPPFDLSQWSSLDLGSATVAPGTTPHLFLQVYSPTAVSPPAHTIQLRVSGNDTVLPFQDVTLTGRGSNPIPLDGVLVLDRSGSMADAAGAQRKIDSLQSAADLFTHLLRPNLTPAATTGDKIGYAKFNQAASVYLPLDFLDSAGAQLAAAEDRLSPAAIGDVARLAPDGSTGIGAGIQTGAGMFAAPGTGARKHVMVLLTDGKENQAPFIADVLGGVHANDPALKMYSIGLGSDVEPAKLQSITNVTNGYYQVTDDLSGTRIYDLESFYFKIFSNATGMSLVVDPTYPVLVAGTSPVLVARAPIISSDRSATFLVLDEAALRGYYDLELVDPLGQVIALGTNVGGTPVQRLQRYNYTLYRVVFPDPALAPQYVGDWILRLKPNGKWRTADSLKSAFVSRGGEGGIALARGLVPIGFAAAVASNYRLEVGTQANAYQPGADLTLTATLTDRGWPAAGAAVKVDVTTPGGSVFKDVPLFDDGTHGDTTANDGVYANRFTSTAESGTYRLFFHSLGKNDRGELAQREESRYVTLAPLVPPGQTPTGACLPCRLLRALWALALILLVALLGLVWRCCRRRTAEVR